MSSVKDIVVFMILGISRSAMAIYSLIHSGGVVWSLADIDYYFLLLNLINIFLIFTLMLSSIKYITKYIKIYYYIFIAAIVTTLLTMKYYIDTYGVDHLFDLGVEMICLIAIAVLFIATMVKVSKTDEE